MLNIALDVTDVNYPVFKKFEYTKLSLTISYRSYLSRFELEALQDRVSKCHSSDNEWEYSDFLRKSVLLKNSRIDRPN